jgi:hypothetical protein
MIGLLQIKTEMTQFPIEDWTSRAKTHRESVSPVADAFLDRRQLGLTHAVHDFLFTYYPCSPLKLKQWIPSFEQELVITPELRKEYPWFTDYWFVSNGNILSLNKERLHKNMIEFAQFVADLCDNVLERAPRFSCFGLHEWAMVYKLPPDALRHKGQRLRLPPKELEAFVESQRISCSHYDAYRFFTPEARPLNVLNPTLDTRLQMEQGGCVHANMDLYKWAIKLWPWIGSDFIAKAFFVALEGRELDMRASPYDLADQGFSPICIETEEGRRQYQKEQQQLFERSTPLRIELKSLCSRLIKITAAV